MSAYWPRTVLLALILLTTAATAFGGDARQLVLVTDQSSGIDHLTTSEIRRLFLGLPITKGNKALKAVINQSDPLLYQVFLQKVVFMSAHVYERHLLQNVIQMGGQRPQSLYHRDELADKLHHQPGTVSYMWNEELSNYPHLVVVGELWRSHE